MLPLRLSSPDNANTQGTYGPYDIPPPVYPTPPADASTDNAPGEQDRVTTTTPSSPSPTHLSSRPTINASTMATLQPWLGLKARLALAPISVALVSLIFVATRMLLSAADVDDRVADVKDNLLATCAGAEGAASTLASLPSVLAASTNRNTVKAMEATVQQTGRVLMLAVTAIEEVLLWFIDSYRSLFVCFMELLVRGSLAVLISAVQLISEAIQQAVAGIRLAIQASVEGVNSIISGAISGVNAVIQVFGKHIDAPQIDVPSLDALSNITLPTTIQDSLVSINSSIPTLDDLRQKMDALITGPFDAMKTEINQTVSGFQFDKTLLPVPPLNNVTFCDKVDLSPLDHLGHDLKRLAYIGAGLIALLMIGIALLCAGQEWWSWKYLQRHVERTREAWVAEDGNRGAGPDEKAGFSRPESVPTAARLLDFLELARHPLLAMFGLRMVHIFKIESPASRARLRWWLSWIGHPAAAAALFAGVIGLVAVELQIVAVRGIQHVYEGKIDDSFDNLGRNLAANINGKMLDASAHFADASNAVILDAENTLNNHIFAWVNTTTSTMNSTLNEFLNDISSTLTDVFGSTPLNAPLQTFIDCFLGSKIAGIQSALTWMHDNAHVNFTTVDDDVLLIGNDTLTQLSDPIKNSLIGGTKGSDNDGVIGRVVGSYLTQLERERLMFYVFLGIYVLVLLIGTLIVTWDSFSDRLADWQGSRRPWLKTRITPFRPLSRASKASGETTAVGNVAPRCGLAVPRLSFADASFPSSRSLGAEAQESSTTTGLSPTCPFPFQLDRQSEGQSMRSPNAASESGWLSYLKRVGSFTSGHSQSDLARTCDAPYARQPGSPTTTMKSTYSQKSGNTGHATRHSRSLSISTAHRRRFSRLLEGSDCASVMSHASGVASSPSPLRQRFSPSPSQHTFGTRYPSDQRSQSHYSDKDSDGGGPKLQGGGSAVDAADWDGGEPSVVPQSTPSMLVRTKEALVNAAYWWYGLEAPSRARDCSTAYEDAARTTAGSSLAAPHQPAVLERTGSASSDRRRQLRFTATPTDQVEARKRLQTAGDAPALPPTRLSSDAEGNPADQGRTTTSTQKPPRPLPDLPPGEPSQRKPTEALLSQPEPGPIHQLVKPRTPSPTPPRTVRNPTGTAITKSMISRPHPHPLTHVPSHADPDRPRRSSSSSTLGPEDTGSQPSLPSTSAQPSFLRRVLTSRSGAGPGEPEAAPHAEGHGSPPRQRQPPTVFTVSPPSLRPLRTLGPGTQARPPPISRPLPHPLGNRIHPCAAPPHYTPSHTPLSLPTGVPVVVDFPPAHASNPAQASCPMPHTRTLLAQSGLAM